MSSVCVLCVFIFPMDGVVFVFCCVEKMDDPMLNAFMGYESFKEINILHLLCLVIIKPWLLYIF